MSRRQHQEEVRVALIQLAIYRQQDGFFSLMGTAGHEETPASHKRSERMQRWGLDAREQSAINVGVASDVQTPGVCPKVLKAVCSLFRLHEE